MFMGKIWALMPVPESFEFLCELEGRLSAEQEKLG